MSKYRCPDCGGDGKETCHNPDHGFLLAMSFHDIGRLGCPVCGHNPRGKVASDGPCLSCNGKGFVDRSLAEKIISDYDLDCEPESESAAERGE